MTALVKGANIEKLKHSMEAAIASGEGIQIEIPVEHYHTSSLYGRRAIAPAGAVIISKVHKADHITIAIRGSCVVVDEMGIRKTIEAPQVFVTPAGTQRAIHVLTEIEWVTVHTCTEQDVPTIESLLTCDTMQEYNNLFLGDIT